MKHHNVTENTINFIMSKMGEGYHTRMVKRVFEELKQGKEVIIYDDEFMFEDYEEFLMRFMIEDFSFEKTHSLRMQWDIYRALTKKLTFSTEIEPELHEDDSNTTLFLSQGFLVYEEIIRLRKNIKMQIFTLQCACKQI